MKTFQQGSSELKEFYKKIDLSLPKWDDKCNGYSYADVCEPHKIVVDDIIVPNPVVPFWIMGREQVASDLNKPSYVGKLKKTMKPLRKVMIDKLKPMLIKGNAVLTMQNEESCLVIRTEEKDVSKVFKFCE
jgi:hypothetical protein